MALHLKITGVLLILFALVHVIFPKRFDWKTDLPKLSLMNRQMMVIHTFFISLVLFLMGILSITSSTELISTLLGGKVALGFFIFTGVRFFIQFFGYSSSLWKGKSFETFVHVAFGILWAYFSVVFFLTYWYSQQFF